MKQTLQRALSYFIGGVLVVAMFASIVFGGTSTITIKDSAGATQTYFVITNGSGQFLSANVICDQSAGASCASVKAASTPAAVTDLSLVVAPIPSELHVGEVGNNQTYISSALVTSNNTVTTGKAIGPLQTLTNAARVSGSVGASGTGGIIQSVLLAFKDAIGTIPMDVYIFNANPSGSTCTDNTTFVLANADRSKVIGIAHVTDWTASNAVAIGQANNLAMPFSLASATSIFVCVVTRGSAAITSTANADVNLTILRD